MRSNGEYNQQHLTTDEDSKERVRGNFRISRRYIKKLFELETTTLAR